MNEREWQVRQAGLERRVAEHLLHVAREEEEHREERRADEQAGDVRARQRAQAEDPKRHQRRARAQLGRHEHGQQRERDREQAERLRRTPARADGVDEGVDEQRQARRDGDRAERVEGLRLALLAALLQQARREERRDDADRHVDPQDPFPAEVLGQDAAEQHAGGAAGARDRAPDAQRLVALGALGERVRDHRQRRGRQQRGAEALQRARGDELRLTRRQAAEQRREREQDEPDHEEPAAAEQVGHPAAEEQKAAERQGVGVGDPGEVLGREVQVRRRSTGSRR